MMLTPHFSLEELTASQTASRLGIDNSPSPEVIGNLIRLALFLEKVRLLVNPYPVIVSSGYRCPQLNAAIPNSSATSYHCLGLAADVTCPQFGEPITLAKRIITSSWLVQEIDQIIYEFGGWVHIGIPKDGEQPRHQMLTIGSQTGGKYAGGIF